RLPNQALGPPPLSGGFREQLPAGPKAHYWPNRDGVKFRHEPQTTVAVGESKNSLFGWRSLGQLTVEGNRLSQRLVDGEPGIVPGNEAAKLLALCRAAIGPDKALHRPVPSEVPKRRKRQLTSRLSIATQLFYI